MSPILLLVVLLLAPEPSAPAPEASPAVAAESRHAVWLDVVARLGDDDERVQQLITERLLSVVSELGAQSSADARRTLHVVVESEGANFVVKLATSRDGEPLTRATEFACEECSGAELLDRLALEAKPVIEALVREDEAPPPPVVAPPPPVVVAPADTAPRRDLGRKGQAGAALLGSGGALLVPGIVFLALGDRRVDADPTLLRNFTPPGIAFVALGCAAVVIGAILLGVDRKAARRGRISMRAWSTAARSEDW